MTTTTAARALGWASLGIAVAELVAPGWLQRQLGVRGHRGLLRALGARELLSGVGLLAADRPGPTMKTGLWSRVGGDVMDLALLGAAATRTRRPAGLAVAAGLVLGSMALDLIYAQRAQQQEHQ